MYELKTRHTYWTICFNTEFGPRLLKTRPHFFSMLFDYPNKFRTTNKRTYQGTGLIRITNERFVRVRAIYYRTRITNKR